MCFYSLSSLRQCRYSRSSDAPPAQGSFAPGEHLFVPTDGESLYAGHPVGCIIAKSRREAEAAAKVVSIAYADSDTPAIYSIPEAIAAGSYLSVPDNPDPGAHWGPGEKVLTHGDVDTALKEAAAAGGGTVVQGTLSIGGQSQFMMEKQTCMAAPDEQGRLVLYCSTQMPDHTRFMVAANLGIPIDKIQVIVKRLGGSFGGKGDKAFWTSLASAACAKKTGRPVSIQNDIHQDMQMAGTGRHTCEVSYKAAMDASGKFTAFDVDTTVNGGRCTGFTGFIGGEILNNLESTCINTRKSNALRHFTEASSILSVRIEFADAFRRHRLGQARGQGRCHQHRNLHGRPWAGACSSRSDHRDNRAAPRRSVWDRRAGAAGEEHLQGRGCDSHHAWDPCGRHQGLQHAGDLGEARDEL